MQKFTEIMRSLAGVIKFLWKGLTAIVGSFVVVFALYVALLLAVLPANTSGPMSFPSKPIKSGSLDQTVAVVNLTGVIAYPDSNGGLMASTGIDASRVIALLKQLEEDDNVKGVLLNVNSPGGGVVASDDIYQQVAELAAKKVVIARFSDVAASGGYYISAPADKIVANPATLTGSIGVIAQLPQYSELMKKVGVEMRVFKSSDYKDIGSPFREMNEDERKIFQGIISDSYEQFVKAVAVGRRMDESKVRALADGRVYTGKQAEQNGLIDGFANQDQALEMIQQMADLDNPSIAEYSTLSLFESILQSTSPQWLRNLSSKVPSESVGIYYMLEI
ncbi:MAG: signal peptide peptidase SppA [Patescibacteria group bacterium]